MKMPGLVASLILLGLRPAASEPLSGELETLLKEPACHALPISLKMPKTSLRRLFDTVGQLVARCPVRFTLDPDVATLEAALDLQNVRLPTLLDVLAGNHDLEYVVDGNQVRVRRKPADDVPRVDLRLSMSGSAATLAKAPVALSLSVLVGRCGNVRQAFGTGIGLRLHPDSAVLEKQAQADSVRVRVCAEKVSDAGMDVLGEGVVAQAFEEGYRSREERTIFRKRIAAGQKHVSLFKTADGTFELKLLDYEQKPATK